MQAVITYETYADAILSIRRPTMKYATWAQPGLLAKPIDRDFGDLPSDMFTFASISDIFADFSVLSLFFLLSLSLSFFLFYVVLRDFLCQDPTRVYRRDIHTIGSFCSRTSFVNDRQRDKRETNTMRQTRKAIINCSRRTETAEIWPLALGALTYGSVAVMPAEI